jgi:hypothetical protein
MKAEQLHVVTAVSNPVGWRSRPALARDFIAHMLDSGARLTLVECAYGDKAFELADIPHVSHIGVRAKTMVWTKENLLNLGIARLPEGWKYVATIDADVRFRNPGWSTATLHELQHYDVVQPWSDCYDLGPAGEHLELHRSLMRLWYERQPILQGPKTGPNTGYRFGHPGYAWAWTRASLEWLGGLIETAALGAADHHMGLALIGKVDESIHAGMTHGYKVPLWQWQARAKQHIAGNVSFVPGTIEHTWHGPKANRAYIDRWSILVKNQFDPATDLKRNTFGVLELAGNKPELRHDIDVYMRSRNEDATTL